MTNIVILSGGSGKRLWPLSNCVRSKQFIQFLEAPNGTRESMMQRTYRMIESADANANILIATSKSQVPLIESQLGRGVSLSVEPCRRDTFPAIALAVACLHEAHGVSPDEAVVFCPSDSFSEEGYFEMLTTLGEQAAQGESNLYLAGKRPSEPSEKFGYIIPDSKNAMSTVRAFREKPDAATAAALIEQGALWNMGVFAFKVGYLLNKARELLGTSSYEQLLDGYGQLPRISFDYAVAEHEERISVLRFEDSWEDLGTLDALTAHADGPAQGNATILDSPGTSVINELPQPLITVGASDLVIAATYDGIVVASKDRCAEVKGLVKDARPMFETRPWGEYRVLDFGEGTPRRLVKHLVINEGCYISYQTHALREELWSIVEGTGIVVIDGCASRVRPGDVVRVPMQTLHAIRATTTLRIIEVQLGEELTEEDIVRFDFDWTSVEGI